MTKTIKLAHQSGTDIVGTWDNRLFCTFCDDGTVSLYVELRGDAGFFRSDDVTGIKTGDQFEPALKQILEITSLADDLDYSEICRLIQPHKPELADALKKIWMNDEEPELPQEIEMQIRAILDSSTIYSKQYMSLADRQNQHSNVRRFLEQFYITHGALPEGEIDVGGHRINLDSL